MTKNEKRELFEEVAWMDAAGIFILWWMIWLLWWYMGSTKVMKWWIGLMIGVWVFAGILFFFKQERNKGIEVMDSYRFTSWK